METGDVLCWGDSSYGQAGNGTFSSPIQSPVKVAGLGLQAVQVASGDYHTCAVLTDGSLWCWGNNVNGQLGAGTPPQSEAVPVQVKGLNDPVVQASTSSGHTCALSEAGGVSCWGYNQYGQASGDALFYITPRPVVGFQQ
jgi:alpha-tubulin suppressor-like RCC1 family protein